MIPFYLQKTLKFGKKEKKQPPQPLRRRHQLQRKHPFQQQLLRYLNIVLYLENEELYNLLIRPNTEEEDHSLFINKANELIIRTNRTSLHCEYIANFIASPNPTFAIRVVIKKVGRERIEKWVI